MKTFFRVLVFGLVFMPGLAKADLTITPTHIVFDGRERFAAITLINTGDEQMTYQMGWRYFRMQETGPAYKSSETSVTEFDLSKHIVLTPRRVTLLPGAKQRIRLALRRPEEVPDGDYHAHLAFSPVVEVPDSLEQEKPTAGIKINVGYTIPVVLRAGDIDVNFDIADVGVIVNEKTGKFKALINVNRSGGPYGAMAHLYVYHKGHSGGEEELVGELHNAHIFPEVNHRVFDVFLTKDIRAGGSLRVVLEHSDKDEDKKFVYAEKTFPLQ